MSKIAITGGAGFIGSNLAKRLIGNGNEIVVIDDMSAGSMANLDELGIAPQMIKGDLRNYDFTKSSLKDFDAVYHLAAEVGSVSYLHGSNAKELAALQSNLTIDTNVFKACAENGIRSIVYASSVSVYAIDDQQGSNVQFKEEDADKKVNPEGGYGWAKYIGEKQLKMMSNTHVGIARIFHAYGPNIYLNEDRSQVIGSLIRKAIKYPEEKFVVWGDGTQRRCFIYIDDVIEAMLQLQNYAEQHGNLTVNIGSTDEVTIKQLAEMIIKLSKKDMELKFDTGNPVGALSRKPDLELAKKTINWQPTTSFQDGLDKTYQWAQQRLLH